MNYSKAFGAAIGGAAVGIGGTTFLPEGTPWYGYLILYALSVGIPALTTYFAPPNRP